MSCLTKVDQFLDLLLQVEHFRHYFSKMYCDKGKSQYVRKLLQLCKVHHRQNEVLAMILQNPMLVITDLSILHELQDFYPENIAFSQPTLKLAYQDISKQNSCVSRGMFSFFSTPKAVISSNVAAWRLATKYGFGC